MKKEEVLVIGLFLALALLMVTGAEAQMGSPMACDPTPHPMVGECSPILTTSDMVHDSFYIVNLTPFDQFKEGMPGLENKSCAPASGASVMDFLNRTYAPGITNGYTNKSLVGNLSILMNTTTNGTMNDEVLFGWMRFLKRAGMMNNFTYKFYYYDYLIHHNGSFPHGYKRNFTNVPGADAPFTWINSNGTYGLISYEFITEKELVVLFYKMVYSDGSVYHHYMALHNLNTQSNPPEKTWNISYMDPVGGRILYGRVFYNGTVIFPDAVGEPLGMMVISPK